MRTSKRTVFSRSVISDEPVWNEDIESLPRVLNWYSYNKTQDDAKEYLVDYAKYENLDKQDIRFLTNSKERVVTSVGWLCKIYLNCLCSCPEIKQKINSEIERIVLIEKNKKIVEDVSVIKKPTVNVQENIKAKLAEYIGEINFHLDEILLSIRKDADFSFCLKTWLRDNKVSAIQAKNIASYFKSHVIPELLEAREGSCEQLVEAYSFLTNTQLSRYIDVVEKFIADSDEQHIIKKQISIHNRTPRKANKNPLRQVRNLKYLKEHEQLKSIVPTKIIGAKAILLYNPETRVVTYYGCDNNHGLGIKGSTLVNYDVTQTLCKILRKPEEVLSKFLTEGRVAVKNTIRDLSSKNKVASGRINDSLLILRAF